MLAPTVTPQPSQEKHCYFCVSNLLGVSYKDLATLQRFFSHHGKIVKRQRSGLCARHQRKIARAIKRARVMGMLPFTK